MKHAHNMSCDGPTLPVDVQKPRSVAVSVIKNPCAHYCVDVLIVADLI
jgi:hypothetical protein